MKKKRSFEEQIKRINEITEAMQNAEMGLEESLALFEEATELIRNCQDYLDDAELRIKKITDKNFPDVMEDFEQ
ncbi:MAG: exodeoxyribonuclease VII small subunit [Bacteroidia bacterium]